MLKLFIGLLLLIDMGLYGYNAGYLGNGTREGREPGRVTNQFNADRIRRVEPNASVSLPAIAATPASTDVVAATGNPPATEKTAVSAQSPASSPATAASCIEIGNFDAADAHRFETQLGSPGLGKRLRWRSVQEVERHIVYIAPAADKEGAQRNAAELRRLGIDDFYVIQDNSDLRWGISLGIFKTADAARQHVADLTQKGVSSAKIAARPGANSKTAYQLRGLDAAASANLAQIRLGFPHQELRACAPA